MFTPTVVGSGPAGFAFLQRTRGVQQALFGQSAQISRQTTQFAEALKDIQTSDQLMADRNLREVALGAFGLEADIDNKAFIQQILDSDLDDPRSLANRLADKRYLDLAQTFNFGGVGGPRLPDARTPDEIGKKMEALQTADDLLSDRTLLRAALDKFGIADQIGNTYFLQEVLNSDLSDQSSFVYQFKNPDLVAFAEAFDFANKGAPQDGMDDIAQTFDGQFETIRTADDLLANDTLLEAALDMFGLGNAIYNRDLLSDVLNSNINDSASVANQQEDPRFAAFSAAFGYGNPPIDADGNPLLDDNGDLVIEKSKMEVFVDTVLDRTNPTENTRDFFNNPKLMLATLAVFDIPQGAGATDFVGRYLNSDPESATSLRKVFPDERYAMLANVFDFKPEQTARTYPEGFVEQITKNFVDRQFEIQIGAVDQTMRVALSLERDLSNVAERGTTNNGRWFSIMGSPVLREVFETSFGLPPSFGRLDIDQQLKELTARSERFFGTDDVQDFLDPEKMTALRDRYLVQAGFQGGGGTGNTNVAVAILSGLQT